MLPPPQTISPASRASTRSTRTASPSQVLVLFGTEFRQLQQEHPEIAATIESNLREIAQAA